MCKMYTTYVICPMYAVKSVLSTLAVHLIKSLCFLKKRLIKSLQLNQLKFLDVTLRFQTQTVIHANVRKTDLIISLFYISWFVCIFFHLPINCFKMREFTPYS